MTTHSPLPWKTNELPHDEFPDPKDHLPCAVYADNNRWFVFGTCGAPQPQRSVSAEEQAENCRFAVRAVNAYDDMLAALQHVQEDYREMIRQSCDNDEADELDGVLQIINAAIAKATATP